MPLLSAAIPGIALLGRNNLQQALLKTLYQVTGIFFPLLNRECVLLGNFLDVSFKHTVSQ